MANRRLPGLQLTRWMERLRGRTDVGDPPDVNYSIQPVHLVGDSSKLVAPFAGPEASFGSNLAAIVGQVGAIRVTAGSRSVRVGMRFAGLVANGQLGWRIVSAAQVTVISGVTPVTLFQHNPTQAGPLDTRVITGGFITPPAGVDYPQVFFAALMTSPVAIGIRMLEPVLELEPGRVLEVWCLTVNAGFSFDGVLLESAMEPTP
jgi:hypothetical protein